MFGASFWTVRPLTRSDGAGVVVPANEPLSKAMYCPSALTLGKRPPMAALLVPAIFAVTSPSVGVLKSVRSSSCSTGGNSRRERIALRDRDSRRAAHAARRSGFLRNMLFSQSRNDDGHDDHEPSIDARAFARQIDSCRFDWLPNLYR